MEHPTRQGASTATPPRVLSITTITEDFNIQVQRVRSLTAAAREIADQLHGGTPRSVESGKPDVPASKAKLISLRDLCDDLAGGLSDLHEELERIKAGI